MKERICAGGGLEEEGDVFWVGRRICDGRWHFLGVGFVLGG